MNTILQDLHDKIAAQLPTDGTLATLEHLALDKLCASLREQIAAAHPPQAQAAIAAAVLPAVSQFVPALAPYGALIGFAIDELPKIASAARAVFAPTTYTDEQSQPPVHDDDAPAPSV